MRISERDENGTTRVVITLSWHDGEYAGEASGPTTPQHRPRIVGEATLRALEQVTENRVQLQLNAIGTTDLGGTQVAVAQVEIRGFAEPFVGSALLREQDATAATVKAVLDALNRRLEQVL